MVLTALSLEPVLFQALFAFARGHKLPPLAVLVLFFLARARIFVVLRTFLGASSPGHRSIPFNDIPLRSRRVTDSANRPDNWQTESCNTPQTIPECPAAARHHSPAARAAFGRRGLAGFRLARRPPRPP